jgi:glycosyltransferase involved in cell wall biosynthesis
VDDVARSIETVEAVPAIRISVIVPARNEAASLGACLDSLLAQSGRGFELGEEWELIVIDDDSTDSTPEIARAAAALHAGVTLLQAPALDTSSRGGFTGKNNACWAGAQKARGGWLLFTDADTVHEPGDLSRALHEAEKYRVGLLSYSPRQVVAGFWQRAVMPLIFSELASVYPPRDVSSANSPLAAANGQFLMVERDAYFSVGSHRVFGREILEDVALARAIKRANYAIRFRYAPDALSTRMYRTLPEMIEGWTKNLALLFPRPVLLAFWRALDLLLFFGLPLVAMLLPASRPVWQPAVVFILWARTLFRFYARAARSSFAAIDVAISIFGVPLFVYLLIRSSVQLKIAKSVTWKGRSYRS